LVRRGGRREGGGVSEQERYQVRFDWGVAGAHAVGDGADVIVWVDAIGPDGAPGAAPVSSLPGGCAVIATGMDTAAAAADWVMDLQESLRTRVGIAVIAAGEPREPREPHEGTADAGLRFAAEDLLAAGAVVDRLAARGLDATSPEAAVAEGAYRHLGRAVGHLMSASVTAVTGRAATAPRVRPDATPADVRVARPHPRA
jgi:2-phosphosulfolactate phosphatase